MTTIEELCRLLNERGMNYRVSATGYSIDIGPHTTAYANRSDTTLDVSLRQVTPAQAIAATLGVTVATGKRQPVAETCHMKLRRNPYRDFLHEYTCSECGETMCKHTFFGKSEPPRWCPNCGRKVVED